MAYIGKEPTVGNFQVCDAISVVNGQAAYTMQVDSANVSPESANHMLVSLNGVLQKPNSSFTISGSTITFASNLATGDVIDFILLLGNVNDIGTPSDATVTNAKTNFTTTSSAAGLQIKGDGTTAGALQLNCEQNSHGIKLQSPAHSSSQSYTLKFPTGNVTADRFLKVASVSGSGTTGIGQLSFAEAGGGASTLLSTTTISANTANIVFNNSVITSSYKRFMLDFDSLILDAQGKINMKISNDNGSSYKSGSNYRYSAFSVESAGNNRNQADGAGSDGFQLFADTTSATTRPNNFRIFIYDPLNTSTFFSYSASGISHDAQDDAMPFVAGGFYTTNADNAFNAIKFTPESGNFDSGVIRFYGIS